ncbi:MAG TPA: DUF445 domain-containing protein [Acidimicrobiales bacterium]|nr:DUF445 domain-containing protein [Acidimicrobiales bacterium]
MPEPPTPTAEVDPAVRRSDIRRAKVRATGLLAAVSVAFLVVALTTEDHGGAGYLRAALEAAMVGGIADWFAVVAIFRHPLGIPIPHTAVIVQRKDSFGQTLGQFVRENFMDPETIGARVRAAGVADRTAAWVLQRDPTGRPANADRVAGHVAELAVRLAEAVEDDDLVHVVEGAVRRRLTEVDVAPLAARLLGVATEEGRHRELVDAVLVGLDGFLAENEGLLRARFAQESPWWVPDVVDDRIFERLLTGVRAIIRGDTVGGSDELRTRIDVAVERIIGRLERDEVWGSRAEELRDELLDHPALRHFLESLWDDAKSTLRTQSLDGGSALRQRAAELLVGAAERFAADREAMARLDELAEQGARALVETFGDEITRLIATTISQWDGEETASRLELLLGRDLQFIRINGTIVGGLAGLAIHALGDLAG